VPFAHIWVIFQNLVTFVVIDLGTAERIHNADSTINSMSSMQMSIWTLLQRMVATGFITLVNTQNAQDRLNGRHVGGFSSTLNRSMCW